MTGRMSDDLVEARVREMNDAIQLLKELTDRDFNELDIHERLSMRYLVIQLVEAASSICVRILYDVFNERAEGFPDCFARLGARGVIPEDLAEKLASAARLRNLLVHRYWDILDERVYQSVERGLRDFQDFISYVRRLQADDPAPNNLDQGFRYLRLSEPDKTQVVKKLESILSSIEGIVFAYLHGSFIERDLFRDIDVAVWIADPEKAFEYAVDLSTRLEIRLGLPLDLQVLNEAPLPFKYHVLTRGRLLLSRDEKLRARIVDEVVRKYLDFMEFLRNQSTHPNVG